MKVTLEIPKKDNRREIEKVYEAEVLYVPFEEVCDIIEALDGAGKDKEKQGWALISAVNKVKPIFLNIFDGLTEEELGRVDVIKGIIPTMFKFVRVAKEQLSAELKNVMREYQK